MMHFRCAPTKTSFYLQSLQSCANVLVTLIKHAVPSGILVDPNSFCSMTTIPKPES